MSCTASPGWYCPPLSARPLICPENWYCPGGLARAMRCPDNRWSAVNSVYVEDCVEQMNVGVAVVVVLFFMLLALSACIWFAAYDWEDRDIKYQYAELQPPYYGSMMRHGRTYDVYNMNDRNNAINANNKIHP